jgi:hypothetical protein
MLRCALLVTPILFFGCASPRPNPDVAGDTAEFSPAEVRAAEPVADADASSSVLEPAASATQGPPPRPQPKFRQRFTLKGGYYGSDEDVLDDGFIILGSWIRPMSDVVASEVEIGYLDASGSHFGVDRDVWAIPVMANVRVNVPLGDRFEVYGGLGLGWFYYDADADAPGVSVSADGFLFGGDAYFGGSVRLGEKFRLGLEGKYYATDTASDLDSGLDSYVVLLTLGFDQ